jgi:DNA repair protein RadC
MRDLPVGDRPREKLTRAGPAALGDHELVAALLGTGTSTRDALAVACDVLAAGDAAGGLARLSGGELERIPGVGPSHAARILAAVELGRRVLARGQPDRPTFRDAESIAAYLMPRYAERRVEHFGVLLLDTRLRLLRSVELTTGTLDSSPVLPRDVFREAMLANAHSVVVFHNHPSGDPAPSADDVAVTARVAQCGFVMGIEVLDHVILGSRAYFSFRHAGRMP